MKTKQKMLTKPITAGFASIFYFKSVKDGIMTGHWKRRLPLCSKMCIRDRPGSVREGVRYLTSGNSDVVTAGTDVLLITLNKTEKEFSQTTLYEDYAIDKNLFHWQSQNKTRPESATGQRYIPVSYTHLPECAAAELDGCS